MGHNSHEIFSNISSKKLEAERAYSREIKAINDEYESEYKIILKNKELIECANKTNFLFNNTECEFGDDDAKSLSIIKILNPITKAIISVYEKATHHKLTETEMISFDSLKENSQGHLVLLYQSLFCLRDSMKNDLEEFNGSRESLTRSKYLKISEATNFMVNTVINVPNTNDSDTENNNKKPGIEIWVDECNYLEVYDEYFFGISIGVVMNSFDVVMGSTDDEKGRLFMGVVMAGGVLGLLPGLVIIGSVLGLGAGAPLGCLIGAIIGASVGMMVNIMLTLFAAPFALAINQRDEHEKRVKNYDVIKKTGLPSSKDESKKLHFGKSSWTFFSTSPKVNIQQLEAVKDAALLCSA